LTGAFGIDTIQDMNPNGVDPRLGTQLWYEQDATPSRVEELMSQAAAVGFGQVRIFLMWPWIQPRSKDAWDWKLWDEVFDAAAKHGIKVKATLTANSGPWWLGTGSVLHSHTLTLDESWIEPSAQYVLNAVQRYARHPALGQWILWNEPNYPYESQHPELARPVGAHEAWVALLRGSYSDIRELNERWRTGFESFEEVPYYEDLVHPAQRSAHWHSWRPYMDDSRLRATLLENELARIANIVREHDLTTPMCVNPNRTLNNHSFYGLRLDKIAEIVDTLGASFHAPWSFSDFAVVNDHASLVTAGLRLLQNTRGVQKAEVTEVQTGNTFYAGVNPLGVGPAEIAATYLAPLLAGADSVTGWCFNTRRPDFEAGEWGLLDDNDEIGARAESVIRVEATLAALDKSNPGWQAAPPDCAVIVSPTSQAVQFAMALQTDTPWSTRTDAAVQGAALASIELERLGVSTSLATLDSDVVNQCELIVVAHCAAWDKSDVARLLSAAERGATVLIDGTSGEFDPDAQLLKPWPGHFAELTGLRSRGLQTSVIGGERYEVAQNGHLLGHVTGVRSDVVVNEDWQPVSDLVYANDATPLIWEREWGSGRLVYTSASLATSLLEKDLPRTVVTAVLRHASRAISPGVRPLSASTTVNKVESPAGSAWGIFAPEITRRAGRPFTVSIAPGNYRDLWSNEKHSVTSNRLLTLTGRDGVALLIRDQSTGELSPTSI